MYPGHLGPGDRVDLVDLPPDGAPLLGFSHRAISRIRAERNNLESNLYKYVGNNPVNLIDPSGLQPTGKSQSDSLESLAKAAEKAWRDAIAKLKQFSLKSGLGWPLPTRAGSLEGKLLRLRLSDRRRFWELFYKVYVLFGKQLRLKQRLLDRNRKKVSFRFVKCRQFSRTQALKTEAKFFVLPDDGSTIRCSTLTGVRGKLMPLTTDEARVVKCCGGDLQCEKALAQLMTTIWEVALPYQKGGFDFSQNFSESWFYRDANKCFDWLDNFLKKYTKYDPWGAVGKQGNIRLANGAILLEPLKVPTRGHVYIVSDPGIGCLGPDAKFRDHGVVKVTFKTTGCVAYFDIGSCTNQGSFGGGDHWFFADTTPSFTRLMDMENAKTYVPSSMDVEK